MLIMPTSGKLKQEGYDEFEDTMDYKVSSRPAWTRVRSYFTD